MTGRDPRITELLWRLVASAAMLSLLPVAWFVLAGLVRVDRGQVALLIKKTGQSLPDGEIAAPSADFKGIQRDGLSEGWHFLNPYTWETIVVDQMEVPVGQVGVKTRLFGKPPPAGRALVGKEDGTGEVMKGIEREILTPGRYAINTLLYRVELSDAVTIAPGYVGVVTRVTGEEPKEPNVFVVRENERGVLEKTLDAGTHYLNPYDLRVCPVDLRSHRFDMMDKNVVSFLSKDGFQITMEASVEWKIDPERVATVYVEYVDSRIMGQGSNPGDMVIQCIVEKVLLPNARALSRIEGSRHQARDFISGETRQQFQKQMFEGLRSVCASQGIQILSALVRKTEPPKAIADPIREREIAIRQREKLQQEMEREKQQKQLAMTMKLQERVKAINMAQADVSVSIFEAKRKKDVALIGASRKLDVARLELEAARNQAAAKLSAGKAAADVVRLKNSAEASGIRAARAAFGDGEQYARFLFLSKVAPAIQQVISNTEGPFVDVFRAFTAAKPAPAAPAR